MENVFDALCSALAEPENKKLFLDSEGVDLMVLMTKYVLVGSPPSFPLTFYHREKKLARSRAIKALDYAMSGPSGSTACETFVDALGLKSLFSTFMGKVSKKSKGSDPSAAASEETSHTLSVVSSLFTNLPSESPSRIRLLAKFVENNYEKVDKLLEIRESAQRRLEDTEVDIERERKVATSCRPLTLIPDYGFRKFLQKAKALERARKPCGISDVWTAGFSHYKQSIIFLRG
jgi:beta-catenin-like protein 1